MRKAYSHCQHLSLVMLPPIAKITHAFAPCPVATSLQVAAHNRLYLIRAEPMLHRNLSETGMIRKRHFDDFTNLRWGEVSRHLYWPAVGIVIGVLPVARFNGGGRACHCRLGYTCIVQRR